MNKSKPVAMWARVGAGFVVGVGAVAVLGMATIYWRGGVLPNRTWYEWIVFACSGWLIIPLFLSVAVKGDVSWGGKHPDGLSKYKTSLTYVYPVALFVVAHHYEPIAAELFAVLFALIVVCMGLRIYFMPLKSKLENIATAKARHGIPLDQPHRIDEILKSGYFRIS